MKILKKITSTKWLFYVLQWTWGILMNIVGGLAAIVLLCMGKKPELFHNCLFFKAGKNWGGLNLGMFCVVDKNASHSTYCHESGHALQNCLWGVLFPFVIGIPSAIRYWYRIFRIWYFSKKGTAITLKPYSAIWFEHQADEYGTLLY